MKRRLLVFILGVLLFKRRWVMEKKSVEYFQAVLTLELESLLRQANCTMSEFISQSSPAIEYLDRASMEMDQTFKMRIRSRESRLINKIHQALGRIEDGSYGICDSCGEDISLKRLGARPVTTKCIDCKEEEETQERLTRRTLYSQGFSRGRVQSGSRM